ncbi:hypothetical protein ABMA28_016050, partial [Loxostege sticticalis]
GSIRTEAFDEYCCRGHAATAHTNNVEHCADATADPSNSATRWAYTTYSPSTHGASNIYQPNRT